MGFLKLRVSHQAQPVPPEKAAGQMPPETLRTACLVSAAAPRPPPDTHTGEVVRRRKSCSAEIPSFGEQEK